MGSYAYLLAAAFVLAGSMMLLGQRSDVNKADLDLARIHMKQDARDAAVSGLNVSMRKLADEQGPWVVASDFSVASYQYGDASGPQSTYSTSVSIVDAVGGDTVDVISTGSKIYSTRRGTASDTTHVIQTRVARGFLFGATPPGLRAAIMSDQTMLVHGDFTVSALLPGVNADIHTNGTLDTRGNSFTIEGMGTYTGGRRINRQQEDNFVPANDWNGSDLNVFQRDSIPIPVWDVARFKTDATASGYYSASPLVIDGDALTASGITTIDQFAENFLGLPPGDYGTTPENKLLVMVENTITFTDAVDLDGYVQFGATGQVDVETHGPDDGLLMSYDLDIPNLTAATNVGIFTTDNIRIEGNATIVATLYSEGSITYLGGTHLIGGQVAKQTTFQGGGTVNIDWVGPGPGIADYFDPYDEPIGPVIVAYAEW